MIKPIKLWKSYSDQIDLLEQRGLKITNRTKALEYLERIGYYRLSGYWYPFRQTDQTLNKKLDQFIESCSFEQAVQLYIFDKKLRLLVLDAIERIEMAVRVDIAYCLGKLHPLAHLQASSFHGNFSARQAKGKTQTAHQIWVDKYQECIRRNAKTAFVKHHAHEYGGQLPVWVAIELWDFGMMSTLFSGMQKQHKDQLAQKYGIADGETFAKWLRSLNHIRNISAHHSRLWNANIVDRSDVPTNLATYQLKNAKPFLYLCLMKQLLDVICPNSTWGERMKQLFFDFPLKNHAVVSALDTGCIEGWEKWELWKNKSQHVHYQNYNNEEVLGVLQILLSKPARKSKRFYALITKTR